MKLLVIGNGMVGQRLLEALPSGWSTSVLGEEPRPAYDRVQLSSFFSGKTADHLSLVSADFFDTAQIVAYLGERAVAIDRDARRVRTDKGRDLEYDALVLATGSYPFVPPIPGRDRPACHVYRTIEDLEAIRASASGDGVRVGTVVGGGLLGLEAAKALRDLGLETNVVEFAPRLMALQVDEGGGGMLRRKIEALGVRVHTGKSTREIVEGDSTLNRMNFADGSCLDTDLIVFSAGIRPRDDLARDCGLAVGERGGIVIDNRCRTSDPNIYAIGECALWHGKLFGLVAPGYQMAQVVAAQLAGSSDVTFAGADMSTKLKLLGVDVASIGDAHAATPGARTYSFVDGKKDVYKKLVVNEDGSRLLGAVLVGDTESYGTCLQMMLNGVALPSAPEDLILPQRSGASIKVEIPAEAQICSCNDVSKGVICAAVRAGCTTIGAIKKKTKAATSCGGCASLVTQILKTELQRQGVAVDNHICEHFPYSRQQLFHLIKVGELHSFDAVLASNGKGLGCDICKPAVGSILASCWNGFVLSSDRAPLQDTNDYYLANMQKDGTYSVVPRVPGGEITPEKLIAIGEVARKYNLYTKITGGQRIDLFGAQGHELPLIWADLIAAGFESGHAYGKAMRTVKSCVGSTWCRYGVQDSVGLAVELENRYRGLRAPHKIKLAVSGCTRECAEAQSKDVGVIATEKGWNLYVCGNGGVKPRHAELLARDLDKATLIRYIDRFLMFYIRTADRLQRTSTWRDNLEGGLEYLQAVVCDDSLNIAADLEADMARIVATYECEWQKAITDSATVKRFNQFVNSTDVTGWSSVCSLEDILPNTGVCARAGTRQIAIFRINNTLYALDNLDPASGVNVLSRGIIGDLQGECVVASPLYKHHYSLVTGRCLEDASKSVNVYPVKLLDGRVWVNAQPQQQAAPARRRRLVVIGNGMAGMRTVEELLELAPDAYDVTVFGAEPHTNYNRILLSPLLAGDKQTEEIFLNTPEWYTEHGVKLHSGDPVVAIDRRKRVVRSQQGVELPYDRLLFATGSTPVVLPIPGKEFAGVVTFRDLADVDQMLDSARRYKKAVVIGGGLLGLEAAAALGRRGMDVTVVHIHETLMERQLDPAAAALLRTSLESRGLKFHLPAQTAAILGDSRARAVRFEDGSELEADLVVMAIGVRPNIGLATQAGLRIERGILVDDTLQTFDPSVYAVGECVQHRNRTFGLVAPLWEQARVCAVHLAEVGVSRYRGTLTATQLKVAGIELYSAGDFASGEGTEALVMQDHRNGVYKRLVIRGNRLQGAVLYGDAKHGSWYFELMSGGQDIGPMRDRLLFGPEHAGA